MPEVRFYLKEKVYREILKDAEKSKLTERQFLQQVVETAYAETRT